MENKNTTPEDFACAVFDGYVEGPENVSALDSHDGCINIIKDKLLSFGLETTTLTTNDHLKKIRKAHPSDEEKFASGHSAYQGLRTNYLYCANCLCNKPHKEDWSCCVVAIVKYDSNESEKKDRACCKVQALFPHSSQCKLPFQSRRNFKMDREHGGVGFDTAAFPLETIVGGLYNNLVSTLGEIEKDGNHYGVCHNFWLAYAVVFSNIYLQLS